MRSFYVQTLCFLIWFRFCVTAQFAHHMERNKRHLAHRSRKYCEPSHNNQTAGDLLDCAPGHFRERRGLYRGQCVPCNCNGLSNDCDYNTGKCQNCQMNTAGDHCERCAEGHYGNAVLRTCRVCPCPLSRLSNSFALGCLHVGHHFECLCKPGHSGSRCERCAIGFYGDPLADGGSCQPCNCNNGYICDPITGDCQDPDNSVNTDDCHDCDSCIQTLTDDLEAMDDELSTLKAQLISYQNFSISLTALKKLEGEIISTKLSASHYRETLKVLNMKVKELEEDMASVRSDLRIFKNKTDAAFLQSKDIFKDVNKIHNNSQELLTYTEDLLKRLEAFLEQLRVLDGSESTGSQSNATRMLEGARQMVAKMRRQQCQIQRRLAEDELWAAQNLLDNIRNLTAHLNITAAEQVSNDLISRITELKGLEKALNRANKAVNTTDLLNLMNESTLSDLQNHHALIGKEQIDIEDNLRISRGTLRNAADLQTMMRDLKNDFARMSAELDGARLQLKQRLEELSKSVALDILVIQAEEHAQELMKLALRFEMSLLNLTNTSAINKSIYSDIFNTIRKAEAAAGEADKAADDSLMELRNQDLNSKAKELQNFANNLTNNAETAGNLMHEAQQIYKIINETLDKAMDEAKDLKLNFQTLQEELSKITQGDSGVLLKQAKDAVQAANNTVNNDIMRLTIIRENLDELKIPSGDENMDNILSQVNKTLNELDKLYPELTETLAEVENQSNWFPSKTNMSDSIIRIKELIERTRQMANMIKGPVLFSGESYIEMRSPKNLEDLRAFTALDLLIHQPAPDPSDKHSNTRRRRRTEDNQFVLYMGNKNALRDYVGMVVRDGVLYSVYKLGGKVYKLKTEEVTKSSATNSLMDRVDFYRVYQDAQVIYTKRFSSKTPTELQPVSIQPNTTAGLLDLHPDEVVLYVGGYPDDFTPPPELRYPKFKGCIELNMLNEHILGLYNFQRAVNITNTDYCMRKETADEGYYFDGTGYGMIIAGRSRTIKFSVLSRQDNALLFYMGNKDSFFMITVEDNYVVLRANKTLIKKSQTKVFPLVLPNFHTIRIIQSVGRTDVKAVELSVNILINYRIFSQAFLGGIPAHIAERHNIKHPPFRGCLKGLEVDIAVRFSEAYGIQPGCPLHILGVRKTSLELGSFLTLTTNITEPDTMISLGFKTSQSNGLVLHTKGENAFNLSLVDGHVEIKDSTSVLRSMNRYDEGEWHYVTAFRNSTGMELNIENSDSTEKATATTSAARTITEIMLGGGNFTGCLRNFYMRRPENRYIPTDLTSFLQSGSVSMGTCDIQQSPLSLTVKSRRHKGNSKLFSLKKESCSVPFSHIQTHHLSAKSQLQYIIATEDLNFRPHFSLDVRTRSSDCLLLHIKDERGFAQVILFMSSGRVKLSVGEEALIYYQKKINNGDWHNIRFSVEQHVTHLVVDGFRVPDGRLKKDEGTSMMLKPPVFIGAGKIQAFSRKQEMQFPKKTLIGCIRDFRFYDSLVGEPQLNHGGAPCFDGPGEEGVYFAGVGSHIALVRSFTLGAGFHLTFEVRPRNLTGLLFHCRSQQGHSLNVYLKKGTIVVQMNDGAGDYSTSVTPSQPCDVFHHVTVTKNGNEIGLNVGKDSSSATGPAVLSFFNTRLTLYIGGVPVRMHHRMAVWTSYVGCLRNVRINHSAVSFQSVSSVFGSINVNECPA